MDGSSYCNTYMSYFEKESGGSIQLKKTLWSLFIDGVQLPQGQTHFEEAFYF